MGFVIFTTFQDASHTGGGNDDAFAGCDQFAYDSVAHWCAGRLQGVGLGHLGIVILQKLGAIEDSRRRVVGHLCTTVDGSG